MTNRKTIVASICLGLAVLVPLVAEATPTLEVVHKVSNRVRSAMRLSPDGKKVLMVVRAKYGTSGKSAYHYAVYNLRTKKERVLCASPGLADDMFMFAFGLGVWAPDSKSFVMIKRLSMTKGRRFGPTTIARCHLRGKQKEKSLAVGKHAVFGGVFDPKGTLYFARNLGTRRAPNVQLCQLAPNATKATHCTKLPGMGVALTMSPDGKALAGFTMNRTGAYAWAYQIKQKKLVISRRFGTDDYLWKPLVYWSLDSRSLFFNGKLQGRGKARFSIFQFRPFTKQKKARFRSLLAFQSYNTMGEISPGVLLVFKRSGMVPHHFHVATKKLAPTGYKAGSHAAQAVGILDRKGHHILMFTNKRAAVLFKQK